MMYILCIDRHQPRSDIISLDYLSFCDFYWAFLRITREKWRGQIFFFGKGGIQLRVKRVSCCPAWPDYVARIQRGRSIIAIVIASKYPKKKKKICQLFLSRYFFTAREPIGDTSTAAQLIDDWPFSNSLIAAAGLWPRHPFNRDTNEVAFFSY